MIRVSIRISKFVPILATLLLYSQHGHAVVSMESLHTRTPQEGFSGTAELAASGNSGNTDSKEYSFGTRLQWHRDVHTSILLADIAYGESNDEKSKDKGFAHARHIYQHTPFLAAEGFLQGSYDRFARLDQRTLAGGGARLTLLRKENTGAIYLGLGAFYETETIDDDYPDSGTDALWRANSYLVLKYQLSPTASLLSTTYYQPAFESSNDYRLTEQAAMKVDINDRLSLVLSVNFSRDNEPPLGVEKDDTSYKTAIAINF